MGERDVRNIIKKLTKIKKLNNRRKTFQKTQD